MIDCRFSVTPDKRVIRAAFTGHANYDVSGKDIVCAAVTTAAIILAHCVDLAAAYKDVRLEPGDILITAAANDAYAVFNTFLAVYYMIDDVSAKYPDYVNVAYEVDDTLTV